MAPKAKAFLFERICVIINQKSKKTMGE